MADPKAPQDPTVLNTPAAPTPKAPEDVLFPPVIVPPASAPTPEVPPVTPPPAAVTPPVVPPATPSPEAKPPTEPAKPGDPASPSPAPTDYVLKLPEGSLLSPEDLAAIQKESKDAGFTKEQAEKMLATRDEGVKTFNERQQQALAKARTDWAEACSKDPEFGGEQYPQNVELAKRAWDKLASPALKQMAEQTGFGNHPEVVRMMVKVGKMFAEPKLVRGSTGSSPQDLSPEERLYGRTPTQEIAP